MESASRHLASPGFKNRPPLDTRSEAQRDSYHESGPSPAAAGIAAQVHGSPYTKLPKLDLRAKLVYWKECGGRIPDRLTPT